MQITSLTCTLLEDRTCPATVFNAKDIIVLPPPPPPTGGGGVVVVPPPYQGPMGMSPPATA